MALASAHELRIQLRKANIDLGILRKQLAASQACNRGEHQRPLVRGTGCYVCGKVE